MRKPPLATIVNFCTNESRFIKNCIEQSLIFSKQVIVSVCDHFFDGTPENRELLERIYTAFPDCLFIEYPFLEGKIPKKIFKTVDPAHFWHSLSRFLAVRSLSEEIENVLFLDADEIPEGNRFFDWLESSDYTFHTALKMANYWYFRESRYRAEKWEDSIVLAQRKALDAELLLRQEERGAIYDSLPGPKRRMVTGPDGRPMFHHYSWVRTEEEMLKKVRSWGHRADRDWETLVKEEFSRPFQGVDFVHGYRYETIEPKFEILLDLPQFSPRGKPNVVRLSEEKVLEAVKKIPRWNVLSFLYPRENR
jgi:hypothetical protein